MLVNTRLAETPDVVVDDVRCNGGPAWSGPEECARPLVIFVRSGCFRRRADGEETFLDPTTMYFQRSGQEQQVGHPRDGGDACTAFELSDELLAFLAGGEPALPTEPVHVDGRVAVAHRRLAAACVAGTDRFEITERASSIVATVLARSGSPAVHAGRPGTVRARRKLVDEAREMLMADPTIGLMDLARALAVSPHHLSRVFKAYAGDRLSRYRNRLRVSLALCRLEDGDTDLAGLAADLGFSDQAHFSRVVGRETGRPPSELRRSVERGNGVRLPLRPREERWVPSP